MRRKPGIITPEGFDSDADISAAFVEWGISDLKSSDYGAAYTNFTEALEYNDDNMYADYGLGIAAYKMGLYKKAILHLQKTATSGIQDIHSFFYLSSAYVHTGFKCVDQEKYDEARTSFKNAVKYSPQSMPHHLGLAAMIIEHGHRAQGEARGVLYEAASRYLCSGVQRAQAFPVVQELSYLKHAWLLDPLGVAAGEAKQAMQNRYGAFPAPGVL